METLGGCEGSEGGERGRGRLEGGERGFGRKGGTSVQEFERLWDDKLRAIRHAMFVLPTLLCSSQHLNMLYNKLGVFAHHLSD